MSEKIDNYNAIAYWLLSILCRKVLNGYIMLNIKNIG